MSKPKTKKTTPKTTTPKKGTTPAPPPKLRLRVADFVIVEHGKSTRGQVAIVESVGEGLITVRKFRVAKGDVPAAWAKNTATIPVRMLSRPVKGDERVKSARNTATPAPAAKTGQR